MVKNSKDFLVSTADVAFIYNGILAFTGNTSLNSSISVSMEDTEIVGGKGNRLLYKFKYGRKLSVSIEMAEWSLEFIAAQTGSAIVEELKNVFKVRECITLTNGVGMLGQTSIGDIFIEKSDGTKLTITPINNTITIGSSNETIYATYQYNTNVKRITIDATSTPFIGELILTADKHNNEKGKVADIQIDIPSFQLSGSFDISLEAGGTTTTKLEGDALAVSGDTCLDGEVYAYISEIPTKASNIKVAEIAATPSIINLSVGGNASISIIGIKGGLYSNISISPTDCIITSDTPSVATVSNGIITGVATGNALINIDYDGITDVISVVVA